MSGLYETRLTRTKAAPSRTLSFTSILGSLRPSTTTLSFSAFIFSLGYFLLFEGCLATRLPGAFKQYRVSLLSGNGSQERPNINF